MQEIANMASNIVKLAKDYAVDTIPGDYISIENACPDCGGDIKENYRRFACNKCDFSFTKTPAGRQLELQEVKELLENKEIGPLQGFRSKQGRPFASILKLAKDKDDKGIESTNTKLLFDFGQNQDEEEVDFSGQTSLGKCPNCGANVFEKSMKYVCEKNASAEKTCTFNLAKVILQQEITKDEIEFMLNTGKTHLLNNFKSARTGRAFKAYLSYEKGKIQFEFEQKTKETKPAKIKATKIKKITT